MVAACVARDSLAVLKKWPAGLVLALLALMSSACFSQTERSTTTSNHSAAPAAAATAKANAGSPGKKPISTAGWSKLTPQQKSALQPLAQSWGSISAGQQRKWLEVSRNFPSMPAEDQANMHSRMAAWGALSNRERAAARLNFATTAELSQELSLEERKAKWEAYQSLSAQEKENLARNASRPPIGAATPIRPVAPQKLVILPAPANSTGKPPKIAAESTKNDPATAAEH
jgi:hypothetical protein